MQIDTTQMPVEESIYVNAYTSSHKQQPSHQISHKQVHEEFKYARRAPRLTPSRGQQDNIFLSDDFFNVQLMTKRIEQLTSLRH